MIMELLKENLTSEMDQNHRKDICKKCEHYKIIFCAKCGCSINLKIKFKKAKCPIDKWSKKNAV